MSPLEYLKKKNALNTAIRQVASARTQAGNAADALFNQAYQGFSTAIHKNLLISDALYQWGFALLHQAKTKTGNDAIKLYSEAIEKFSFCRVIDPDYLGAAIDGGVAFMELARLKQVEVYDKLYSQAKESFEVANRIQQGSASYNLACFYSLFKDEEYCLAALQTAREHGSLPSIEDMTHDPDLQNVVNSDWFVDFIKSLSTAIVPVENTATAV
jgi:tetratricopeptide (TPR) repeat protein